MAKASAVTIYGIKNCDTMKKARAWLDAHGIAYAFLGARCRSASLSPSRTPRR